MKARPFPIQTLAEFRDCLAEDLQIRDFTTDHWAAISRRVPMPGGFRPVNEEEYRAALAAGRDFQAFAPPRRRRPRRPSVAIAESLPKNLLNHEVITRARYQSDRLADLARADADVLKARQRLLQVPRLTVTQVRHFLESRAVHQLPEDYFTYNGIPIVGHRSQICQRDGRVSHSWDKDTVIRTTWPGGSHDASYFDLERARHCGHEHVVEATWDGRSTADIRVRHGSVLDSLWQVSEQLASRYSWPRVQALWFLLTDRTPIIDPIRVDVTASYGSRGTFAAVTMIIEPWVSEHVVRRIYKQIQWKRFKPPAKVPAKTSLAVAAFVSKEQGASPEYLGWQALWRRWKKSGGRPAFGSHDALARAYLRTMRWLESEIWSPRYRLFEPNSAAPRRSRTRGGGIRRKTRGR